MIASSEVLTSEMKCRVYLDNSNFLIEGQRAAAVKRGWARDYREAFDRNIIDPSWRPSYTALMEVLRSQVGEIASARLFGSFSETATSERVSTILAAMEQSGWRRRMRTRGRVGLEKCVDVDLAIHMTWEAAVMTDRRRMGLVLIAGDRDYVPLVEHLVANAYHVTVVFWNHAARDLTRVASRFISLDGHFSALSLPAPSRSHLGIN